MKHEFEHDKAIQKLQEQGFKINPVVVDGVFHVEITGKLGEFFSFKFPELAHLWKHDKVSLAGLKELDRILRENKKIP